jgi:hypothetical protein
VAISDAGKNRLSITLAVLGMYLFVVHPNAKGTNKPAASVITILRNGIENSVLKKEQTNKGKTTGTVKEVTVIIATTVCSLPPIKFTTKGAFNPVEMPDSNKTDRDSFG